MKLYLCPGRKTSRNWSKPIKWCAFLFNMKIVYTARWRLFATPDTPCFPERVAEINKTTSASYARRVFGQKFTRNAKNCFKCLKLIWSETFATYNTQPLWL